MTGTANGLGKAAVALGLEGRLLKDGVLPARQLTERAEVVEGIVGALLEKGDWRKAVDVVFSDNAGKVLYSSDKTGFYEAVAATIKVEDFKDFKEPRDGDKQISALVNSSVQGAELVYNRYFHWSLTSGV